MIKQKNQTLQGLFFLFLFSWWCESRRKDSYSFFFSLKFPLLFYYFLANPLLHFLTLATPSPFSFLKSTFFSIFSFCFFFFFSYQATLFFSHFISSSSISLRVFLYFSSFSIAWLLPPPLPTLPPPSQFSSSFFHYCIADLQKNGCFIFLIKQSI